MLSSLCLVWRTELPKGRNSEESWRNVGPVVIALSGLPSQPSVVAANLGEPTITIPAPGTISHLVMAGDTLETILGYEQPLVRSISSKDGGLTWGEYKDEFWTPTGSQLWSVASLRARDGSIHMFPLVQRGPLEHWGISYFLDVWHTKTESSDFGARWGHQRLIHQGYVGAIINAIQLPSGRMVLPFAQWIGGKAAGPPTGPNVVISIVSDDGGTTRSPSTTELTVPVEKQSSARPVWSGGTCA